MSIERHELLREISELKSKLSASEAEKAGLETRANSYARRLNEAVVEKDNWQDDCRKMHGNRDYWKERAEKAEAANKNFSDVAKENERLRNEILKDRNNEITLYQRSTARGDVIIEAQQILARYLAPDNGISEKQAISELLGLLDGPKTRAALKEQDNG